jgi:hypothetical protein
MMAAGIDAVRKLPVIVLSVKGLLLFREDEVIEKGSSKSGFVNTGPPLPRTTHAAAVKPGYAGPIA